jgi:hypothetical protein
LFSFEEVAVFSVLSCGGAALANWVLYEFCANGFCSTYFHQELVYNSSKKGFVDGNINC